MSEIKIRLTGEQRNFIEGMEMIIRLYRHLKDTKKDRWYEEPTIELVSSLIYKTLPEFTSCLFNKKDYRLHLYKGNMVGGGHMHISPRQFEQFISVVDAFVKEHPQKTFFKIEDVEHTFNVSPEDERTNRKIKWSIPVSSYREDEKLSVNQISTRNLPLTKRWEGLVNPPNYSQVFQVKLFNSDFTKKLIPISDRTLRPYSISYVNTPCKTTGNDDLTDLIRFIFVKYYHLFGSFNRIKRCKYKGCQKLVMEKKSGAKSFCDKKCRKKYNIEYQDEKIRLCRERQNQWIRNQLKRKDIIFKDPETGKRINPPDPGHVQKKECDACSKPMKSGFCGTLREKNKRALASMVII